MFPRSTSNTSLLRATIRRRDTSLKLGVFLPGATKRCVCMFLTMLTDFLLTGHNQNQYTKNGQPFAIRNASDPRRPVAILPLRYLEEVKNAPQSKLSFPLFMEKVLEVCLWMRAAWLSNHDVLLGFGYQRHLWP